MKRSSWARGASVLAAFLLSAALPACERSADLEAVPPGTPRRVVVLLSGAVEILADLGALDRVVAVGRRSGVPEAEAKVQIDADFETGCVNVEALLALEPDLVVANEFWRGALQGLGLRVHWVRPDATSDGVMRLVEELGALVGREERAREIVEEMRRRIASLRDAARRRPRRVRVYFEGAGLGHTSSRGTIEDEMIRLAGGENIAGDQAIAHPVLTNEAILAADPEVIILSPWTDPPAEVARRPGWDRIAAVRDGRVHQLAVDRRSIMLLSPRGVEDAERLLVPWFHGPGAPPR